eukprot:UN26935
MGDSERKVLTTLIHKTIANRIHKHMELKANKLQELVDQSRKGFTNSFKRLFGGRAKNNKQWDRKTPRYYLESNAEQASTALVRVAGDLCFYLVDGIKHYLYIAWCWTIIKLIVLYFMWPLLFK